MYFSQATGTGSWREEVAGFVSDSTNHTWGFGDVSSDDFIFYGADTEEEVTYAEARSMDGAADYYYYAGEVKLTAAEVNCYLNYSGCTDIQDIPKTALEPSGFAEFVFASVSGCGGINNTYYYAPTQAFEYFVMEIVRGEFTYYEILTKAEFDALWAQYPGSTFNRTLPPTSYVHVEKYSYTSWYYDDAPGWVTALAEANFPNQKYPDY